MIDVGGGLSGDSDEGIKYPSAHMNSCDKVARFVKSGCKTYFAFLLVELEAVSIRVQEGWR